jgi:hypothetical protein
MVFSASGAVEERRRNGPTCLLKEDLLKEERYGDKESRSGVCVYTCRSRLPRIPSVALFLWHLAPSLKVEKCKTNRTMTMPYKFLLHVQILQYNVAMYLRRLQARPHRL